MQLESLLYGDGVFETLRIVDGRVLAVARHLKRLEGSCQRLEFAAERTSKAVEAIQGLKGAKDGIWRITVTRDADLFGDFKGGVLKSFREHVPATNPALVSLSGFYFPEDKWAEIKSTSYVRNIEARRAAIRAGAEDALLVSEDGRVGEASTSNCFVVFSDEIATPPVQGILPGTRRAAALAEMEVVERPIFLKELEGARGIVLSSALGFRAAKSLNGRQLDESVLQLFKSCEDAL